MKLTLHLKHLRCHTFPRALTKVPSRGKGHTVHAVMTKVDVADMLVPALETVHEAAVEDRLDERDIALNCMKLNHHHSPSVQKIDGCNSVQQVYSDPGRQHRASCWAS